MLNTEEDSSKTPTFCGGLSEGLADQGRRTTPGWSAWGWACGTPFLSMEHLAWDYLTVLVREQGGLDKFRFGEDYDRYIF